MEKLLLFSFCDEETDVKHVDEANFLTSNLNEYNIIDLPVLIHRFTTSVQFGKLDGFYYRTQCRAKQTHFVVARGYF